MLTFLDEARSLATPDFGDATNDWPTFRHHVRYRGIDVTGIDAPAASGGWLVQPPEVVLALPGWEDAFETIHGKELHTLFDIEKIVRMLLHGSHLAFEILASSSTFRANRDSRQVLEWTLNKSHLGFARDSAATLSEVDALAERDLLDHTRRYLQGAALARGEVSLHLDTLVRRFDVSRPASVHQAREILDVVGLAPDNGVLPATPTDYERLSRWLVAQRLEER